MLGCDLGVCRLLVLLLLVTGVGSGGARGACAPPPHFFDWGGNGMFVPPHF